MNIGTKVIKVIDYIVLPLCITSTILYLLELSTGSQNSYESNHWFLILERYLIFPVLFLEYIIRWWEDYYYPHNNRDKGLFNSEQYELSYLGIIDLISWVPFVIGFFLPVSWAGFIRALRILRLLKLFRYSKSLQLGAIVFHRSLIYLKTLGLLSLIMILFSGSILYQLEPDTFDNKLSNAMWYSLVTASTVGYGDFYPKDDITKLAAVFLLFLPAGAIYAGLIGVVAAMFQKVLDEHHKL